MSLRTVLVVLSCWALVAVAFTVQQVATSPSPVSLDGMLAIAAPTFLFDALWAVVTFAIIYAEARFPPGEGRILRRLLVHSALGVAAAVTQLFVYDRILALTGFGEARSFTRLVVVNLSTGIVIYWMTLGAVLLVEQRRRARERQRAQEALAGSLAETRAAMLRAQLQPHFLFNTLNTVAALIPEEPATAERMVARLGDLLRISLDETRGSSVSLSEDLAALDAYLAIEALRLGDRLRVARDIEPGALAARVPDLLLQPLVENAVLHGIAPSSDGGTVSTAAWRDGSSLVVRVADDGVGAASAPAREGVGLRNTRERIALLAGPDTGAGLSVRTAPGEGFEVTATLPWTTA